MKKLLGAAAVAALSAAAMPQIAQAQILAQPGETMGVALGAPLPEGVFFVDLESYGKRDGQNNRLGVNIPIVVWSTPFSFYDTRLEVLYAAPFTHIDGQGAGAVNRTDIYSQGLLFLMAHSFGNGFSAGILAGPRSPDNFTQNGRGVLGDFRLSTSYVNNGLKAVLSFHYQGNFGGSKGVNAAMGYQGFRDNIFVDYTLTKTIGKVEFGVVGTAYTDIGGPSLPAIPGGVIAGTPARGGGVAVGGLIGYDFGKVTAQAMVTREVYVRNGGYGLGLGLGGNNRDYETRGWLRLIIPLYVAPAAPAPVVARY